MVMTEKEWYGSREHFRTEMSYKEYLRKAKPKDNLKELKDLIKRELRF